MEDEEEKEEVQRPTRCQVLPLPHVPQASPTLTHSQLLLLLAAGEREDVGVKAGAGTF